MPLLEQYVREAMKKQNTPKYLLMPVRAAREAGVPIPFNNVKSMNKYFGTQLTRQNWSQWMNKELSFSYDTKEIGPLMTQFEKLA